MAHVPLSAGWSLWRDALLRGAAFPLARALALASPRAVAEAEALLEAEQAAEGALDEALDEVRRERDGLDGPARREATRALKALESGRLPPGARSAEASPRLARFAEALAAHGERVRALELAWPPVEADLDAALRAAASDGRLREAVLWQNRPAVRDGLDGLVRHPEGADHARTRKRQLLVASYLQRYCAKNDMIGFFGPSAWARLEDEGPLASARPGPGPERAGEQVCLEPWAAKEAARVALEQDGVRWHVPPRLRAELWVEAGVLRGLDAPRPLSEPERLLLEGCDGRVSPAQLSARLLRPREELERDLARAVDQGILVWELPVAIEPDSLRLARSAAEAIADPAVRERAKAPLLRLDRDRQAVRDAAGSPEALAPALDRLDATFVELTGGAPTRGAGQTYAGRTLTSYDCRRPVDAAFGPALAARLAPPLCLVLQSARWFTFEIARQLDERAARACAEAAGPVPLPALWPVLREALVGEGAILDSVQADLRRRWAEALGAADQAGEARVADLRDPVARLFAAPRPGWPTARHHAPDVLLAAGADGGEPMLVLGEVHAGVNTYTTASVLGPCDRVAALEQAWRSDQPFGRRPALSTVPNEAFARSTLDARLAADRLHLDLGGAFVSPLDPARVVRVGDCVVDRRGRRVQTRDGRHSFSLVEAFDRTLGVLSAPRFQPFDREADCPRLALDGLVVRRRRWQLAEAELDFARCLSRRDRFVGARRLRRSRALPRFVFVKSPEETKPFFVDFDSPVLTDLFARAARGVEGLAVCEMLPGPSELWLADGRGERLTSELRLIAMDPVAWSAEPG